MEGYVLHRSLAPDVPLDTLYALLQLRVEVFVVEQECPYQDLDGRDLAVETRHFWLAGRENSDEVIGCLRMRELPSGAFRIGRVCVARHARRKGAARRLMQAALGEVGDRDCVLDAQSHLIEIYTTLGFEPSGDSFTEDGIEHTPMRRTNRRSAPDS